MTRISHEEAHRHIDALRLYVQQQQASDERQQLLNDLRKRDYENGGRALAEYMSQRRDTEPGKLVVAEALRLLQEQDRRITGLKKRVDSLVSSGGMLRDQLMLWHGSADWTEADDSAAYGWLMAIREEPDAAPEPHPPARCAFSLYAGPCGALVPSGSRFCAAHADKTCVCCGKEATGECSHEEWGPPGVFLETATVLSLIAEVRRLREERAAVAQTICAIDHRAEQRGRDAELAEVAAYLQRVGWLTAAELIASGKHRAKGGK